MSLRKAIATDYEEQRHMEAVDIFRTGNPGMPEYNQYDADSFGYVKCGKSSPRAHMRRRSIQHFECTPRGKR